MYLMRLKLQRHTFIMTCVKLCSSLALESRRWLPQAASHVRHYSRHGNIFQSQHFHRGRAINSFADNLWFILAGDHPLEAAVHLVSDRGSQSAADRTAAPLPLWKTSHKLACWHYSHRHHNSAHVVYSQCVYDEQVHFLSVPTAFEGRLVKVKPSHISMRHPSIVLVLLFIVK